MFFTLVIVGRLTSILSGVSVFRTRHITVKRRVPEAGDSAGNRDETRRQDFFHPLTPPAGDTDPLKIE